MRTIQRRMNSCPYTTALGRKGDGALCDGESGVSTHHVEPGIAFVLAYHKQLMSPCARYAEAMRVSRQYLTGMEEEGVKTTSPPPPRDC